LGGFAKVCFGYIQVTSNPKKQTVLTLNVPTKDRKANRTF